jgi:hypothetical protein
MSHTRRSQIKNLSDEYDISHYVEPKKEFFRQQTIDISKKILTITNTHEQHCKKVLSDLYDFSHLDRQQFIELSRELSTFTEELTQFNKELSDKFPEISQKIDQKLPDLNLFIKLIAEVIDFIDRYNIIATLLAQSKKLLLEDQQFTKAFEVCLKAIKPFKKFSSDEDDDFCQKIKAKLKSWILSCFTLTIETLDVNKDVSHAQRTYAFLQNAVAQIPPELQLGYNEKLKHLRMQIDNIVKPHSAAPIHQVGHFATLAGPVKPNPEVAKLLDEMCEKVADLKL